MSIGQILNEVLALAAIILPFAGAPATAGLVVALLPRIDALISALSAEAARTNAWTPEEQAAFQARIDALRTDPAWVVTP
jgi:hypothetical protein